MTGPEHTPDGARQGVVLHAAAIRSLDPVERLAALALDWIGRFVGVPLAVFHAVGTRLHEAAPPIVVRWPRGPAPRVLDAMSRRYSERHSRGDPLGVTRFARTGWTVVSAAQAGGAGEIAQCGLAAQLAPYGLTPCGALFVREHGRITARVLLAAEHEAELDASTLRLLRGIQPLFEHAHACARTSRSRSLAELFAEAQLTPREREVALHAVSGATNEEIARALCVAPATVKTHLVHIYGKLGVQTRVELVTTLLMAQSPPPWRFPRTSSGSPSTCTAR